MNRKFKKKRSGNSISAFGVQGSLIQVSYALGSLTPVFSDLSAISDCE